MGLISDGGVHSHYHHLYELINISEKYNSQVYIHGFTDGRDVDPKSSILDIKNLEGDIKKNPDAYQYERVKRIEMSQAAVQYILD